MIVERVYNVLFLCTGNSARSIMAEAILNSTGKGRFKAYSAGSFPSGTINSYALDQLRRCGIGTEDLRSKSWGEFALCDAPGMDFVFTVCDNAAGEVCPIWPGQPMTAHWGVEDPGVRESSDEGKRRSFHEVFNQLRNRIGLFAALPMRSLDKLSLQKELDAIGKLPSP